MLPFRTGSEGVVDAAETGEVTMRYGFIGLGDQGGAMAKMMLRGGLPLAVWARRSEALTPFVNEGATATSTASELASGCDLLSICVTADVDVKHVIHTHGVLEAMRPGSIIAIHSTVLPSLSVELAKTALGKQVHVLDAPVSGSARGAFNKTLLMMIGGDAAVLEKARAAFSTYANPIIHVGAVGTAMRSKLLNNLVAAAQKAIAVRTLRAAPRFGLDADVLQKVILAGVGRSMALEIVGRLQDPKRAAHIAPLVVKDMQLAREALPDEDLKPLFALADEAIEWMDKWALGTDRVLTPPAAA
jgi:3-hydroxyisobutyrate dehydrogenase